MVAAREPAETSKLARFFRWVALVGGALSAVTAGFAFWDAICERAPRLASSVPFAACKVNTALRRRDEAEIALEIERARRAALEEHHDRERVRQEAARREEQQRLAREREELERAERDRQEWLAREAERKEADRDRQRQLALEAERREADRRRNEAVRQKSDGRIVQSAPPARKPEPRTCVNIGSPFGLTLTVKKGTLLCSQSEPRETAEVVEVTETAVIYKVNGANHQPCRFSDAACGFEWGGGQMRILFAARPRPDTAHLEAPSAMLVPIR